MRHSRDQIRERSESSPLQTVYSMSKQSSHRKHSNKSASITVRFLFPEESSWTEKKIENCRTVRNVGLEDRKKPTKVSFIHHNIRGLHTKLREMCI